jgi:hypothetical protein
MSNFRCARSDRMGITGGVTIEKLPIDVMAVATLMRLKQFVYTFCHLRVEMKGAFGELSVTLPCL